jgi:hypothetical protein
VPCLTPLRSPCNRCGLPACFLFPSRTHNLPSSTRPSQQQPFHTNPWGGPAPPPISRRAYQAWGVIAVWTHEVGVRYQHLTPWPPAVIIRHSNPRTVLPTRPLVRLSCPPPRLLFLHFLKGPDFGAFTQHVGVNGFESLLKRNFQASALAYFLWLL